MAILRFLSIIFFATFLFALIGHVVAAFSVDSMSSTSIRKSAGTNIQSDGPIILVIGSCGLDRLLTVSAYPTADSKIRTTAYAEVGGGNAANTASAIGKLVDAKVFCSSASGEQIRVQLLSKVGDDVVGQNIIDELHDANVETSSLLFHRGPPGSTTAFTTVIVDEKEQTRTCIHTPGTCGELSLEDVQSLSQDDIDQVFRNAVHLHSDARHTDVSLWMAKEAKKRGIRVSCDCEKDRNTKSLDELIDVCDVLFTNSNHLGEYLKRLTKEREAATGRQPLAKKLVRGPSKEAEQQLLDTYARSLTPSMYFSRWQQDLAIGKEVVVTHGSMGALHFKQIKSSKTSKTESTSNSVNDIEVELENPDKTSVHHKFDDGENFFENSYEVHQVGIMKDATVVDTTGAGDAFIGGYILMSNIAFKEEDDKIIENKVQMALETGSFVGGRKVGGPGARTALPTGGEFDLLGSSAAVAKASLQNLLGPFNDNQK